MSDQVQAPQEEENNKTGLDEMQNDEGAVGVEKPCDEGGVEKSSEESSVEEPSDEGAVENNKRSLDEMTSDDGGVDVEKSSEEALKNKKFKSTDSTTGAATPGSSTSSPPAPPQVVSLIHGQIYRIQSYHLGEFNFRAGDMPFFYVNGAPVTISDSFGNVIFSGGTFHDRVEVKETVNIGWFFTTKTVAVTLLPGGNPRPRIQLKGNSVTVHQGSTTNLSASELNTSLGPVLEIVGIPKKSIVINGRRSAVVNGCGGVLTFNGAGEVTVQGCLEGLRNNGPGTVNVKGCVKGEVRQTGSGSIEINGDVHGDIWNSGEGSIKVGGRHLGNGKVKNVPGLGRVSIANGTGIVVSTWKFGWGSGKKLD